MRLVRLFIQATWICSLFFSENGWSSKFNCDQVFTQQLAIDNINIPLLEKKSKTDFLPNRDTSYQLMDFSQIGSSTPFQEKEDWASQKLRPFFESLPVQPDYRQTLSFTIHATEFVFKDLIQFLKRENKSLQVNQFGFKNSAVYWKEIFNFWKKQQLTEEQMTEGKIALLHLLQQNFHATLPLDHFFVKFFMADNIDQMEVMPTTLTKKNDPEFFRHTTFNYHKLQARIYLLHTMAMVPVGSSRPMYFHKEEMEAISYITNEISALAPNIPLPLLESAIKSYTAELELALQRRVRPFLANFPLHRGMSNFFKNVKQLEDTSKQLLGQQNDDLNSRIHSLTNGFRENFNDSTSSRKKDVDELLAYYNEDPADFLKERPNIFKAFDIDTIIHLIKKLDLESERQDWANEYYWFIRKDKNFLKKRYYQQAINELRLKK